MEAKHLADIPGGRKSCETVSVEDITFTDVQDAELVVGFCVAESNPEHSSWNLKCVSGTATILDKNDIRRFDTQDSCIG